MSGPIFIIGCARSGTTWLGRILQQAEGLKVTIEDPVIFPLVDEAVLFWERRNEIVEGLIPIYKRLIAEAGNATYVDKSHQNIWLVEWLDKAFPDARYIAIEREAFGTIASMMRHPGVLRHFAYWRQYPLPNRHLGIEKDDAAEYESLPLSIKCALRWQSHHERLSALRTGLGRRIHFIQYELLVEQTEAELRKLSGFVGHPIGKTTPDGEPMKKGRAAFSTEQRARISKVIEQRAKLRTKAAKSMIAP